MDTVNLTAREDELDSINMQAIKLIIHDNRPSTIFNYVWRGENDCRRLSQGPLRTRSFDTSR